ncbi:hypothetical protein [Desulfofustis limnaeus]|jgi:hypothetical protein|uniref:DUF5666 domain-containing protein n=1 Tax=Desulfofustis limnaeus TaxID=2740163 RepID=A0ABM7W6K5_9BACT|nr:hypothetical protein [Desulfofustis limnaeus]MDX9895271.1 hypothetical protein [Desulfofustis sp.]BDD86524.1 hypothetical protein DPPLL_08890 [Desulfofustis limnaeus]
MIRTALKKRAAGTIFTLLLATITFAWNPGIIEAKKSEDEQHRTEYRGIIEKRPDSTLHGEWIIGNRLFTTSPTTEFDQDEGPLAIGTCAEVDLRNGSVHEIDSEPMSDCR